MSDFFEKDSEMISHALTIWANYIETHNVCKSAVDAKRAGAPHNALDQSQMSFVVRLRTKATQILKEE